MEQTVATNGTAQTATITATMPNTMTSASRVAESIKAKATTPVVPTEAPKTDTVEAPSVTSANILSRTNDTVKTSPDVSSKTEEVNVNSELDKISDPAQRAIIEKKLKDLESGYNKKYQDVANQRKELEELRRQVSTWTPERLRQELAKPEFIQAMQVLQQSAPPSTFEGTAEEYSALSDSEKARFRKVEQDNLSLQSQLAQMRQKEEDAEIKKLYPDFRPEVVDEAIEGLRTGKIVASRADIWKVVNHDQNVEKGYKFGYEDGYKKALEKLNANSNLSGKDTKPVDDVPDEVRKGGFSSIAMWRLGQLRNGQTKR